MINLYIIKKIKMRRRRKHYNRRRASYKRKLSILKKENEIIEILQMQKNKTWSKFFETII